MQKQKSQSVPASKSAFGVQDVLFVLFKHKWMILFLSLIGFGAAGFVFHKRVPIYQSEAKLLVRYVLSRENIDSFQAQSSPGTGSGKVDPVISTEMEILTSVDLAKDVAGKIGVDRLLPEAAGTATPSDAAGTVLSGLTVNVGKSTKVLHLVYSNEDPALSKSVLNELVDRYFQKHLEIHRSATALDMVGKQTEVVRARLKKTEEELNKLRTDTGLLSLADATSALASQRARTHEDLMAAKAEFAEQQASIASLESETELAVEDDKTGQTQPAGTDTAPKALIVPPPPQAITEYRTVLELLTFLQKRDFELQVKFKGGNRLITLNQQQIANYDSKRKDLEAKYPNLAAQAEVAEQQGKNPQTNLIAARARLAAVQAKIQVFENHLNEIGEQFSEQYSIGARIEELDRRKQMEDAEYRNLEAKLKNAEIDGALDPSRMPNITIVQHPTEPVKSYDEKVQKLILGLAGGGMALGLGLAFLIELLFDRRVKRPMEIQTRLQLPLLLSIPFIRRKERGGFLLGQESGQPRIGMGEDTTLAIPGPEKSAYDSPSNGTKKVGHFILPYSETIRDRIIFNFEINNLTHKPKLVAVTGLSEGAGASTVAAGVAKSFSEIPGMKVLLVDLSSFHPEDNPLFGEIPRHTLNGALHLARNTQFRDNPQALYYASANARRDDTGLTTFSPVHLYELMPHLQASQYDYIIFDMPPVDQTSRTLTMAGLMDKVLLVLDAENTSRDGLMWGYSELVKGRADVSCIFNKTRSHVPGWLIGGEG